MRFLGIWAIAFVVAWLLELVFGRPATGAKSRLDGPFSRPE